MLLFEIDTKYILSKKKKNKNGNEDISIRKVSQHKATLKIMAPVISLSLNLSLFDVDCLHLAATQTIRNETIERWVRGSNAKLTEETATREQIACFLVPFHWLKLPTRRGQKNK